MPPRRKPPPLAYVIRVDENLMVRCRDVRTHRPLIYTLEGFADHLVHASIKFLLAKDAPHLYW